jgi:hypothetical protein
MLVYYITLDEITYIKQFIKNITLTNIFMLYEPDIKLYSLLFSLLSEIEPTIICDDILIFCLFGLENINEPYDKFNYFCDIIANK